jgi:hypothetical protein
VNVDQPSPYEVYCEHCRVSFPVGTRSCIHCGARIGRPQPSRPIPARPASAQPAAGARPAGAVRRPASPPVLDEDEEELPTRSGVMSPMAILWVVLILGGAIYRACS